MLTFEKASQFFEYKDGFLYWKQDRGSCKVKGKVAGNKSKNGYWEIQFCGIKTHSHRIIFLLHHGYLPKYIDHIDRDPSNNKIENLREATQSQNMMNSVVRKNNACGIKGVFYRKLTNNWVSKISVQGKSYWLGSFATKEEAGLAYQKKAKELHKDFCPTIGMVEIMVQEHLL
jgi:hypothetical protein